MPDRPHILFLMSDEHRPDVLGYAGDPVVRTPVLDALARDAVVFRNAYCASPICVPGRQCMMAGQLPSTCGVHMFGADLPPFSMTFAERLGQFGYEPVCCGKLHHMGRDQMQGWRHRPFGDQEVAGWACPKPEAGVSVPEPAPKPAGTGKWPQYKEVARAAAGKGPYQRFDLDATAAAENVIERVFTDPFYDRPSSQNPLLLKVSLLQPHYPYFTDRRKFTYYLDRVTPHLDDEVFDHPFLGGAHQVIPGEHASEWEIRRATAAYYGMIETIDELYGRVLEQLRHVGQDPDDWVIVYTSDHGEMLGEHGVWEKQKFFDASARVPLFIRWPKRFAPREVRENVNLCDLFATLCALTDTPLPPDEVTVHGRGLDSRSLVPLMQGETDNWHRRYHDETISQFNNRNLMIKRGDLKYQFYAEDGSEVLFDLDSDPGERRNAIGEARHAEAVTGFRQRRAELGWGPDADANYRNAGYAVA